MPVKDPSLKGKSKDSERRVVGVDDHELEGTLTRAFGRQRAKPGCLFW
jgi:hypothetical protein